MITQTEVNQSFVITQPEVIDYLKYSNRPVEVVQFSVRNASSDFSIEAVPTVPDKISLYVVGGTIPPSIILLGPGKTVMLEARVSSDVVDLLKTGVNQFPIEFTITGILGDILDIPKPSPEEQPIIPPPENPRRRAVPRTGAGPVGDPPEEPDRDRGRGTVGLPPTEQEE